MLYDTSPPFKISSPMGERKHLEAALKNEDLVVLLPGRIEEKGSLCKNFWGSP